MGLKVKLKIDTAVAQEAFRRSGPEAVRACANHILDESRKQVPLDIGTLMRSGAVDSDGLSATVSYDTPYARRWHEERANFQRGRKNKYLEDVINDGGVQRKCLEKLQERLKI